MRRLEAKKYPHLSVLFPFGGKDHYGLYLGYIDTLNEAQNRLQEFGGVEFLSPSGPHKNKNLEFSKLLWQETFSYNAIFLHEMFFDSLSAAETMPPDCITEILKVQLRAVFQAGPRWAILRKDSTGDLSITTIAEHDISVPLDLDPVLVLDFWEHSYYQDFGSDKDAYFNFLWKHINWEKVLQRLGPPKKSPKPTQTLFAFRETLGHFQTPFDWFRIEAFETKETCEKLAGIRGQLAQEIKIRSSHNFCLDHSTTQGLLVDRVEEEFGYTVSADKNYTIYGFDSVSEFVNDFSKHFIFRSALHKSDLRVLQKFLMSEICKNPVVSFVDGRGETRFYIDRRVMVLPENLVFATASISGNDEIETDAYDLFERYFPLAEEAFSSGKLGIKVGVLPDEKTIAATKVNSDGTVTIMLAEWCPASKYRQVLAHELIHATFYLKGADVAHHGESFQNLADQINLIEGEGYVGRFGEDTKFK